LLSKEGDRSKADSFETRLERFKTLRAKANLYRDLLKNDAEDLTATIESLNNDVTKALMGELKQYPQQKQFPYKSRVEYDGKAKDKYGDKGTVAGYCFWTDCNGEEKPYVKILFDKINQIKMISITQLKTAK
jgi:hypothetical protein